MFSLSGKNYLKAFFQLESSYPKGVSTNALAEEMDTKASSVTEMVKKLSEKDLVKYKKYQGVKLSSSGRGTALEVIRKHRLWEVFLVEKLSFAWDEVHEVAEQLEHIKSKKLVSELDRFLGYPTRDPHGDPIPDRERKFAVSNDLLLAELPVGEAGICTGVRDSSAEFLQYLNKNEITLGLQIKVLEREEFDDSLLVKFGNSQLWISRQIAGKLFLKKN